MKNPSKTWMQKKKKRERHTKVENVYDEIMGGNLCLETYVGNYV